MKLEIKEQFRMARNITPRFGMMTFLRGGKSVNIPLLEGEPGALLISEDQDTYIAADGSEWLIGTQNGELVKRRFA